MRSHIMALKHKQTARINTGKSGSSPLQGEVMSSFIVDFYLEKGVAHIDDSRQAPTFVHYFTKHISKLQTLVSGLNVCGA